MRPRLSLLIAGASLGALALFTAGCHQKGPQRAACPAGEKCLEYGNTSEPNSLDPQIITGVTEFAIVGELMQGLMMDGPSGEPVPGLAYRWETSPDGLIWTFHIRPAKWSDGKPVTADDFVYAYRRILDPKTASPYAYMLYLLKNGEKLSRGDPGVRPEDLGVRALDAHTLELTLDHPAPYLPQILRHSTYYPVPAHVVAKWGAKWVQPAHYVSDGPYKLVDWRLGDYVRIEKNPNFWQAEKVCFDRITFYPSPDVVTAERRVKRGELDINNTIQSSRVAFLRQPDQMPRYVRTHPYLSTSYVIFNTRDFKPLKDVRVRQALSMTIDREFITKKLLRAGQVPTTAFVPSTMAGYGPPGGPLPKAYWADWSFPRRQREAVRLLAAAGFNANHALRIELKTANATDSLLIAQALQADWMLIGVKVKLAQNDPQIAGQAFRIRDFQVGLQSWIADFNDPINFLTLMKSGTGAQNYGDYNNPKFDALLDESDHEPDGDKRAVLMQRAEQLMLDDASVAPMYNGVNRNLVNPRITGWVDNAVDLHRAIYLCLKR